ncbi:mandelate racemase/muconate lactonizing enzyme family protein [Candidatus Latescibacterota bacterium]
MSQKKSNLSRRKFITRSTAATAAVAAGSLVTNADLENVSAQVNTNSSPSDLKITDIRVASARRAIIRIDTNQGIHGYGEGTGGKLALLLKNDLIGENPCNVEKLYKRILQFGNHNRTGISGIEMALWDIAGKAWDVPVWQMLGGRYRDKILMYADTPWSADPVEMGNILKARIQRGYKFLKMDMGISLLNGVEDTIAAPPGVSRSLWEGDQPGPLSGMRITPKGLKILQEYSATIRDVVGWEIPIATDHFGHFMVEDCMKIAQALDPFNFAWYEDFVPFMYPKALKMISDCCKTPVLVGETMFGAENHRKLFEERSIAMCHPDLIFCGGILEAKKIGDLAEQYGIAMAIHMNNGPVAFFASVHSMAATENFMVMEYHSEEDKEYGDMVDGVPKPLVDDGYIQVPNSPGLGFELNEEACRKRHPDVPWFPPTPEWDNERRQGRRFWSFSDPIKGSKVLS